ncbi:GNAT family N-acetyltransferase [Leptospira wolffii]|uniref:GNAT family N-acetyltransferase n=1 Tax=Leptospira wolffii TaxID=409998 RepID=A0A2M9ZBJ2_9LEPT|nr:GNAT family N-acetyltransferase [Leptospira wolffii]PJZ65779.1 GNAT family N-acetyltransferase [Leptospira wolffii]
MKNLNLHIRPARPEDAEAAVPLIYSSGPASWDFVFNEGRITSKEFLTRSFRGTRNTISYKNHFVAEKDGEIVGTIVIYTSSRFLLWNAGTAGNIFRTYGWRAPKVAIRGLTMEGMIQPPKSGCLYLGHIAVPVSWRKKGIGEALIRFAVSTFPEFSKISLDVSQENPGAKSLYEKVGFKIVESRKFSGPKGKVPDHYYMEADRSSFS